MLTADQDINAISTAVIPLPKFTSPLSNEDWSKKSLRKCLVALGVTDAEMRFRKGARSILDDWTGEVDNLLKIVKDKWRAQAIRHHEANGGDQEKWKNVNVIYSAVLKKLSRYIKNPNRKQVEFIHYQCIICKGHFNKKMTHWAQAKTKVCKNENCRREWARIRMVECRNKRKVVKEKYCQNPQCGRRFFLLGKRGDYRKRFCSLKCRNNNWKHQNIDKLSNTKRTPWKEWFASLTEEQKAADRLKRNERRRKYIASCTPEQLAKIRAINAAFSSKYYYQRKAKKMQPVETI